MHAHQAAEGRRVSACVSSKEEVQTSECRGSERRGSAGAGTSDAGAAAALGAAAAPPNPPSSGKASAPGWSAQRQKRPTRFHERAIPKMQSDASAASSSAASSQVALTAAASSVPQMLLAGMLYRQLGLRQGLRWRRTRICFFSDRVEYLDVVDEGKGVAPTVIRRADIANVRVGDDVSQLAFSFTGRDRLGVRLRALTSGDFNRWVAALQTPADQLPAAMAGVTSVAAAAMALMAAQACAHSVTVAAARDWLRREEGAGMISTAAEAAARKAAAAEAEVAAEAAAAKAEADAAAEAEAALVASARPIKLKSTPLGFGFELGADGQTITTVRKDSQAARAGLGVGERVLSFRSESGYGNALGGSDGDELAAAMSGVRVGESVEFHVAKTAASREAKGVVAVQKVARGRKVRGVSPPTVAAARGQASQTRV